MLCSVIGSVTLAKMPKFMWEFDEIKVGHADRQTDTTCCGETAGCYPENRRAFGWKASCDSDIAWFYAHVFCVLLNCSQVSEEECKCIMQYADTNHNGELDAGEIPAAIQIWKQIQNSADLLEQHAAPLAEGG
eukprot:COSAG06_NODE_258_length_18940_cov_15.039648_10_plen_133_part_00